MANTINKLTPVAVKNAGAGKHGDGGGLYLMVSTAGSKSWSYFYSFEKRRREMALGSLTDLPLPKARDRARELRDAVRNGIDPLAERAAAKAASASGAVGETFADVAKHLLDQMEPSFKNMNHRAQWHRSLTKKCHLIADRPVADIKASEIVPILSPIWLTTPIEARKLRGRIERVFDAAKALEKREKENPARWRGGLIHLLPRQKKASAESHYAAIPYEEISAFLLLNRGKHTVPARALEFLVLTGLRTREVIGARWKEINEEAKIWIVPGERMKMGEEHRVPLSDAAIALLRTMAYTNTGPDALIFPGAKSTEHISNMAMIMNMRRLGYGKFTVHGLRSTFKDWAVEETDYPDWLSEQALAHQVGSKVRRAYRRRDALEKRRALMQDWADYCMAKLRPATMAEAA